MCVRAELYSFYGALPFSTKKQNTTHLLSRGYNRDDTWFEALENGDGFCYQHFFFSSFFSTLFSLDSIADGPKRCHPVNTVLYCTVLYLWSLRIFPSLPGSRLTNFYRDASSALLQLVN